MLNTKNINILSKIIEEKGITNIKTLADLFGVTERSIRYDLDLINEFFQENNFEPFEKGKKGEINFKDLEKVRKYIIQNFSKEDFSSEGRIAYILMKIYFEDIINLNHLADELYISRSTIRNAMVEIKNYLKKYNLSVELKGNIGLELCGNEENIRKSILSFLGANTLNIIENEIIESYLAEYFDFDMTHVHTFINYIQKKLDKLISDEAFNTIATYLFISIYRRKKNKKITEINNFRFLTETNEYKIIDSSIALLEANYDITFNKEEIGKISEFVIGSHSFNFSKSYYENWVELEIKIKELIDRIGKEVAVNLNNDEELLKGLINHIIPTLYRLKNRIEFQNSIYDEVYKNYQKLFDIIEKNLVLIEKNMSIKFSKEEIAYLVVHFKGAIDRNSYNTYEKTKLLLVCNFGYGSSKLLAQKIKDNFNVEIVDIIPKYLLGKKNYKVEEVDYIISTIEIEFESNIPKILVNPMLNREDIDLMESLAIPKNKKKVLLSGILGVIEKNSVITDKNKLGKDLIEFMPDKIYNDIEKDEYSLKDLIRKKDIHIDVKLDTWQEVLRFSGEKLEEQKAVSNRYTDEMVEVIDKYGAYIVIDDYIAIPHAKSDEIEKTAMSLVILKEKVVFPGNKEVKVLLPFSSRDNKEHLKALVEFSTLISEEDFKKELFKERIDIDKILKYINK